MRHSISVFVAQLTLAAVSSADLAEAADLPLAASYGTQAACNAFRANQPMSTLVAAGEPVMLLTTKSVGGTDWSCSFNTVARMQDGRISARASCVARGEPTTNTVRVAEDLSKRVARVQIDDLNESFIEACR